MRTFTRQKTNFVGETWHFFSYNTFKNKTSRLLWLSEQLGPDKDVWLGNHKNEQKWFYFLDEVIKASAIHIVWSKNFVRHFPASRASWKFVCRQGYDSVNCNRIVVKYLNSVIVYIYNFWSLTFRFNRKSWTDIYYCNIICINDCSLTDGNVYYLTLIWVLFVYIHIFSCKSMKVLWVYNCKL